MKPGNYILLAVAVVILYLVFTKRVGTTVTSCLKGVPNCGGAGVGTNVGPTNSVQNTNQPAGQQPKMTVVDGTSVPSQPGNPSACYVSPRLIQTGTRITWCLDQNSNAYAIDALPDQNIPVMYLTDPQDQKYSEDLNGVPANA